MIWLKLYFDLFDDIEFCLLPDETKFHFIGLMMLATKLNNRLPNNPPFLTQRIGANKEINIELLVEKAFLLPFKMLKTKSQTASDSASTDKEQQQEQDKEQDKEQQQEQVNGSALSKFSYQTCFEYAKYRRQFDSSIRSVAALARHFHKTGDADPEIQEWLAESEKQKAKVEQTAKEQIIYNKIGNEAAKMFRAGADENAVCNKIRELAKGQKLNADLLGKSIELSLPSDFQHYDKVFVALSQFDKFQQNNGAAV